MTKIKFPPIETIIEKAREALNAGELQCQQDDFVPNSGCMYAGPCVLGAAFSPEERIKLDEYGAVDFIFGDYREYVEVDHFTREQEEFLTNLQENLNKQATQFKTDMTDFIRQQAETTFIDVMRKAKENLT